MSLKKPSKDPVKSYRDTHWGYNPRRVVKVPDQPGMPQRTTEMGKLKELHVKGRGIIHFDKDGKGRQSLLSYDPPPRTRLYLQLTPETQAVVKSKFIHPSGEWYPIKDVAKSIGGRQAKYENRKVSVQAIGRLTHVAYATAKKGDGPSTYIHRLGEEGGIEPMLCVDKAGRLYIVGGTNAVLNAGITR